MATIGYGRVSTIGQSLEVQLEKLNNYGCDKVFTEKRSGTNTGRPALQECLNYLREGDTLVITKLDRLARSSYDLAKIAKNLEKQSIDFVAIDQKMDTTTPTGKLLFNLLASIAEFENSIRRERQLEGIAKAKENNVRFGRPQKITESEINEINELRSKGIRVKEISEAFNISIPSVYRLSKS